VGTDLYISSFTVHEVKKIKSEKLEFYSVYEVVPCVVTGNKNSPTITYACRKRQLKWVATLPLGDINTEAWSSGMGVWHGANNPTL
jgi:hypothetical protein